MKKVAIVGVEGSGKTVMLAGLGELYSKPDEQGYFLSPKNFTTASYVADKIVRMRQGEWPTATAEDVLQGLDWTLRRKERADARPADVCEISCLDFAGEVYRAAFGIKAETVDANVADEVEELKAYIRQAQDLIVLVNLRDVIDRGLGDPRVRESVWITKALLEYALSTAGGRKEPRAMIVLSQADSYAATIAECGGAKGVLEKYLRDVANNYGWLDIVAASAVDKTRLDDDGHIVPAPDFQPTELRMIMDWVVFDLSAGDGVKRGPVGFGPRSANSPTVRSPRTNVPKRSSVPPQEREGPAPVSAKKNVLGYYFGCFTRYARFRGRACRKEYWGFFLFNFLAVLVLSAVSEGVFGGLYALAAFLPATAVLVRRLHDINRSGWWWLLAFIPYVGWAVLLIFLCLRGTPGDNDYGLDPLQT